MSVPTAIETTASQSTFPAPLSSLQRILITKLDGIGDFVLLTPFLRELRSSAPQADIDLLVGPWSLPFAEVCPYVTRAVGVQLVVSNGDGGKPHYSLHTAGSPEQCAAFLENYNKQRYNLALVPRWDHDEGDGALITRCSNAPYRIGFSRPQLSSHLPDYTEHFTHVVQRPFAAHEVEHNAAFLAYLQGTQIQVPHPQTSPVELWINPDDMNKATRVLDHFAFNAKHPWIALCPGASGGRREVPAHKLRDILQRVEQMVPGVRFLILGRESDKATALALCNQLQHCRELCGTTSLRETAAFIALASAAVTMDSGPAHIAAATETPVVVFSRHHLTADKNRRSFSSTLSPLEQKRQRCPATGITSLAL